MGGQLAEPPSPPAVPPESPARESPAAAPSAAASLAPDPPAADPPAPDPLAPEPPAATPPAAEPPPAEPPAPDPPAPPAPPKPFPPPPPAPPASLVVAAPPLSTPPEGALFIESHAAVETPRTNTSPVACMICLLPGRLGPRRCSSSMSVNGHKRAKASTYRHPSLCPFFPLLINISSHNGMERYGCSLLSPLPFFTKDPRTIPLLRASCGNAVDSMGTHPGAHQ
jgi:hypothetical protein